MSRHLSRAPWIILIRRVLAGVAIVATIACSTNCSRGPTAPSPTAPAGDPLRAVTVSCQAELLIGERAPCIAVARYGSGRQPVVSFGATWSSSRPDVVGVDELGTSIGVSGGEAAVTASYQGRQATTAVVVKEIDGLRIASGQAEQGAFAPGSTVTMWLQGYYSVASAPTGRLSLRISDQNGTVTATQPLTVEKGGNFFLLSATFVVPSLSVEVCRTAVLEIGGTTIAEPQSKAFPLWCIPIRR